MHRRRVLSQGPSPGRAGAPLLLGTLLGGTLLLTGCGPGAVRAVPFGEADSPVCRQVAERWPDTVGRLGARVTAVQSPGVAAWGDPPIVARCGKAPLGPTTDQCIDVDGVDWVATTLDDGGTMFTTFGRSPAVEVLVPADYDSPPLWLPPFRDAVEQIPQTLGECTSAVG